MNGKKEAVSGDVVNAAIRELDKGITIAVGSPNCVHRIKLERTNETLLRITNVDQDRMVVSTEKWRGYEPPKTM